MIQIARGRAWSLVHTVCDDEEGVLADLSGIVFACAIRIKTGVQGQGFFRNALVASVSVDVDLEDSQITLSLDEKSVNGIKQGTYQIELIGTHTDGEIEVFIEPEDVVVTNSPAGNFNATGDANVI
jgi:hypothetical protein